MPRRSTSWRLLTPARVALKPRRQRPSRRSASLIARRRRDSPATFASGSISIGGELPLWCRKGDRKPFASPVRPLLGIQLGLDLSDSLKLHPELRLDSFNRGFVLQRQVPHFGVVDARDINARLGRHSGTA